MTESAASAIVSSVIVGIAFTAETKSQGSPKPSSAGAPKMPCKNSVTTARGAGVAVRRLFRAGRVAPASPAIPAPVLNAARFAGAAFIVRDDPLARVVREGNDARAATARPTACDAIRVGSERVNAPGLSFFPRQGRQRLPTSRGLADDESLCGKNVCVGLQ
eukprot:30497-Pelagococcus_subviridis.AAC.29